MGSASNAWNPKVGMHDGPKYTAVLDTLERDIRNGTLVPGDRLPPQRHIADHFGVTISTITKAITEAARRGLVHTTPGSGTFIAPGLPEVPDAGHFIEMGINLVPQALCEDHLRSALRELTGTGNVADTLGYRGYRLTPGSSGHQFTAWLAAQGYPLDAGTRLTCNGTQQGLLAAMRTLSKPGDAVICEGVTYTGILRIIGQLGLVAHGVDMDREGALPDALERALKESGAKLIVLTPTAQNPTGATMSDARRAAVAALARRYDAMVIEDAVTAPVSGVEPSSITRFAPDHCIYLTGASKSVAPGVRFGVMRVPDRLAAAIEVALTTTNWMGPAYFAELADLLARSGRMDEIVALYRADASARQELARRYLGGPPPTAIAYHYWHGLTEPNSADSVVMEAAGSNIHLSSASSFTCPNYAPPNALRLCLGAEPDLAVLEDGLRRLTGLLANSRPLAAPVI
ncbi:hypothetical protein DLJ53_11030 [Acuticoccus sediminis]|uniref:HTH gntR-type domain-containing protein n=2 Tax=Acuticoccus sediminis TaxID=2184697 RepID=A0A8B2NPV1_9HYPH|nr:hypothetical protein DLJ53_11030 [Acuticoccus sediminis]